MRYAKVYMDKITNKINFVFITSLRFLIRQLQLFCANTVDIASIERIPMRL